MKSIAINEEQLQKIKTGPGFVAALDQSGGSTPKALRLYGIQENTWSSSSKSLSRLSPRILCRLSSRRLIFTALEKEKRSNYSKQPSSRRSTNCQLISSSCSSLRCRNRTTSTPTLSNIPAF